MKKFLLAVMVFALSLPGVASALVYSPTVADLAGWTMVGGSSTSTLDKEFFASLGKMKISGNIYGQTAEPSIGYVDFGRNYGVPLDLTAYSTFGLNIANNNESTWNYYLYAMDNDGYMAVSPPTPIVNKTNQNLELSLAGLDLDNIVSIGLHVTQIVPMEIPGEVPDRVFETTLTPVPEPGTMILLGAGFLGLAIYGKRRRNA